MPLFVAAAKENSQSNYGVLVGTFSVFVDFINVFSTFDLGNLPTLSKIRGLHSLLEYIHAYFFHAKSLSLMFC